MLLGSDFNRLSKNEEIGHFVSLYEMTPQQFICKYENELEEIVNLENKLVVSVECGLDNPVSILGAYYPREDQIASLSYHGHISFIDVKSKDGKQIELLCKDDECTPQDFDEWFDIAYENHCLDDYKYFNKEYCLKLINTVIQGASQDLNISFSSENIIVLEGL